MSIHPTANGSPAASGVERAGAPSEDVASAPGAPLPTSRTEAFSDGVFAIAATLLVLQIGIPTADDIRRSGSLLASLLHLWPSYLTFVAAFITIGALWVAHHDTFRKIAGVDRTLLCLNLILLMEVSLIPFPTALLAQHITDGPFSAGARTAAAAYAVLAIGVSTPWAFMWAHLRRHPELLRPLAPGDSAAIQLRRSAVGIVAYVVALVAAIALPIAAVAIFIAAPAFFVLTTQGLHRPVAVGSGDDVARRPAGLVATAADDRGRADPR